MRGLYVANDYKNIPGVDKKVKSQINAFNEQKLNIYRYNLPLNNCIDKIITRLPSNINMKPFKIKTDLENIDYIYIRKPFIDKSFIKELKRIKRIKPNLKIIMELPTYPYDKEITANIGNIFILLKEKIWRKKLYKYIDRIATYSQDDSIFNIKTLKISNGIDTKDIKVKKNKTKKEINIIAVASFSRWHGYDRFIEGMGKYYESYNGEPIYLHLVGDGQELEIYKGLVKKYNLGDKVIFHGRQTGDNLDQIYDNCDIALDAMGRHRSGVFYNSSLKGKEYAAKGIPSISGVETELDYAKGFKYYFRVPADESYIDICEVIKFYNEIYKNDESYLEVINEIREYAEQNFDIRHCLEPIITYFREYK